MLTPRFELSQTDDGVTVIIHAPYANIKDAVVHVDGTDFRFYSTPYYLRLNLPGQIEENDASTGEYDCEKGDFTLKLSKVHKGEHFENLDMITTLLAPPKKKSNLMPTIEVISNPCAAADESINENEANNKEEEESSNVNDCGDEWYTTQNPLTENEQLSLLHSPKYGFANKISGDLTAFEDTWIKEIIDLPSPDKVLPEDRKKLREQHEVESFNEEHYMADLVELECVAPYLSYECEWEKLTEASVHLNETEKDLLKELPNKEYLLDESELKIVLYSMIDILFASCYNCRTTLGENTVESSWTINKLSSTLSWFQSFTNVHDVILSSVRRSLCYPLVRNWKLAMKVFEDVKKVVKLGKKYIIKRFCEIHSLFNNSHEPRYILNQLYIKDYLIWLQKVSNSKMEELSSLLEDINLTKEEVGFDLDELEAAAYSVQNDDLVIQNDFYTLPSDLEKLIIDNENNATHNGNSQLISHSESDSESDSSSSSSATSSTTSSGTSSSSSTSSTSSSSCSSSNSEIIRTSNSSNNSILDSDDEPN